MEIEVNPLSLACKIDNNRPKYLIVKYQAEQDVFYTYAEENKQLIVNSEIKCYITADKTEIIAASYGTAKTKYDVIHKHYRIIK